MKYKNDLTIVFRKKNKNLNKTWRFYANFQTEAGGIFPFCSKFQAPFLLDFTIKYINRKEMSLKLRTVSEYLVIFDEFAKMWCIFTSISEDL